MSATDADDDNDAADVAAGASDVVAAEGINKGEFLRCKFQLTFCLVMKIVTFIWSFSSWIKSFSFPSFPMERVVKWITFIKVGSYASESCSVILSLNTYRKKIQRGSLPFYLIVQSLLKLLFPNKSVGSICTIGYR